MIGERVRGWARRPPLVYGRHRRTLAEVEGLDAAGLERWTAGRLARVAASAARLPGYRAGGARDFAAFPILRKDAIVGRETAFGSRLALPYHVARTGGTTGVPLALRRSVGAIAFEQAAIDHVCALAGFDLASARAAWLRADFVKPAEDMTPPFWRRKDGRTLLLSSFHLAPGTVGAYAEALRAFGPTVLFCYPSSLQHLVALVRDAKLELRIPFVFASSELLAPEAARGAASVLGATVIDYYGQAERVVASFGLDGGPHRIVPAYGYAETVATPDGGLEIVGTGYWNAAQVLVRYATGDRLIPEGGPAGAGPLTPEHRFRIDGRVAERVDLSDGRRVIGLNHLPRGVPGISSLQVRVTGPDAIEALVVPTGADGPETDRAIERNVRDKFPPDVRLTITRVAQPVRIASGKAPLLLRE